MITSREAAALTEQSEECMAQRLKQIDVKIREAASLNKRELILDYALPYDPIYKVQEKRVGQSHEFNPIQYLLKEKLKQFGYELKIKLINTKIGGEWEACLMMRSRMKIFPIFKSAGEPNKVFQCVLL